MYSKNTNFILVPLLGLSIKLETMSGSTLISTSVGIFELEVLLSLLSLSVADPARYAALENLSFVVLPDVKFLTCT